MPRFVDVHVAVYWGSESGLPFVCRPVRLTNATRSLPDRIRTAAGRATRAGDPTTIAGDASEAGLVPCAVVSVTVHVYVRFSVAPPTAIGTTVAPRWTADLVTPPLLDLQVTVNFVIGDPWFAPAT
jgi:hypothetical protein